MVYFLSQQEEEKEHTLKNHLPCSVTAQLFIPDAVA